MWKVNLKIFFKESWKKYGFVFLMVLVQCVGFRNLIQQYNTVNGQEWKLHFWDYVICFFQGTVPYTQSEGTAAHVVYSQENGGYPSSIIFYPGVNNSGSIVGASYKATIAVLPATYQSERDETKDYAFLSLNYNYLLKYQI